MKTNGNDYVTPITETTIPNGEQFNRLTKREYFAAMALQGILSTAGTLRMSVDKFAEDAVTVADALINELNKEA